MADPESRSTEVEPGPALMPFARRRPFVVAVSAALAAAAEDLPATWQSGGMTRRDMRERAARIAACGSVLVLGGSPARVVAGHYCQTPAVCPICAHRIAAQRTRRALPLLSDLVKRGDLAYHLVLTQRGRPAESLNSAVRRLQESVRRFVAQGQRRGTRRGVGEWGKVTGAVMGIECKPGRSAGWHVHAHAVVCVSEPLDTKTTGAREVASVSVPWSRLRDCWYRATKGDAYNVGVFPITGADAELRSALGQVVKYAVYLGGDPDPARIVEAIAGVRGRRLFSCFGALYGAQGDQEDVPDGPYLSWRWDGLRYAPGAVLERLPGSDKAAARIVAKVIAWYRAARARLVSLGAMAADLDALCDAMRYRVGEVVRRHVAAVGSAAWVSADMVRRYNATLYARFFGEDDPWSTAYPAGDIGLPGVPAGA